MPKFSVIVPAYNKGPHIRRCISSILNQTYQDFELLLVYDKSSDNTLEEIQSFKGNKIRIFTREIPGPGGYAARNLGMENAKADWIAFLDADDEWYPNHLEKIAKIIETNPNAGIIGAGFIAISGSKQTVQPYYLENKDRGVHHISFLEFIQIYLKKKRFGNTSVIACQKNALKEFNGFPEGKTNKGGDLYTWIKIFSKYNGVWSPHIGANIYHDAVNKVTSSSYFDIPFLKGIINEIELPSKEKRYLKKYINTLIFKDYIRHISNKKVRSFKLTREMFYMSPINSLLYLTLDAVPINILAKVILKRVKN